MQSGIWGRRIKANDAERQQIKLRAAALDRVSTASTTIGVLAPLAGAFEVHGLAALHRQSRYAAHLIAIRDAAVSRSRHST
jgi:hypothetical protein